ncbi:hypothetical protein [Marinicella meishanensis]|nr:hypothetical protein [Marinicella sp. NBU2979]
MRIIIEVDEMKLSKKQRQALWFVTLWAAGVLVLLSISGLIRWVL